MSVNVFDESLIARWIEEVLAAFGFTPPEGDPDAKTVNLQDRGLVREDHEDFEEFRLLFRAFKDAFDEEKARELATMGAKALCHYFPSELLPETTTKKPLTSRDRDTISVAESFGIPFSEDTGYEVKAEDEDRVANNFGRPTVHKIRRLIGSSKRSSDEYLRMIIRKSAEIIEGMPAMPIRQGSN
jgi:hypothetical protein